MTIARGRIAGRRIARRRVTTVAGRRCGALTVAEARAQRHALRHGRSGSAVTALSQALPEAHGGFGGGKLAVALHVELVHVAGALLKLLVERKLLGLRFGLRLGDAALSRQAKNDSTPRKISTHTPSCRRVCWLGSDIQVKYATRSATAES